ncbi:MAG: hypothetical protein ABEJ79_10235 [Halolamina sp.]
MTVVRTVLAVLLAVALMAASLPAVDVARTAHATGELRETTAALSTGVERFAARNDPIGGGPGARLSVAVRLPARTATTAPVDRFVLDAAADAMRFRVRGGTLSVRRLPVSLSVSGRRERLELTAPGTHRLTFRLRRVDGGEAVVVTEH